MIPQLGGQIYAMAGMRTELNLKSDAPGVFSGVNTQFNGKGFQNQKFKAIAVLPGQFPVWVARAHTSAARLDSARYAELAHPSILQAPVFFSAVEPGLFDKIIQRYEHAHAPMPAVKTHE